MIPGLVDTQHCDSEAVQAIGILISPQSVEFRKMEKKALHAVSVKVNCQAALRRVKPFGWSVSL